MKIYTKTGDKGETGTLGNKRVLKSSTLIETVGDLDELNSNLGLSRFYVNNSKIKEILIELQKWVFKIGTYIITQDTQRNKYSNLDFNSVLSKIEKIIDEYETNLSPLKNFILPGGSEGAAWLHLTRTICRRAERTMVLLYKEEKDQSLLEPIRLLNRMSDLLFVLARYENFANGVPDTIVQ